MKASNFSWIVLSLTFLTVTPAAAVEDSPSSRETLKELPGVVVSVPRKSGCEQIGLSGAFVKTESESQLKEAGIKVLKAGEGLAVLRIVFTCLNIPGLEASNYFAMVRLDQTIPWPGSSKSAVVVSWGSELGMGINPHATMRENLGKEIRIKVNQFIGAWLSVNGE